MGTKTLMSLEEFERLPEDGMRHELNQGELVAMSGPKFGHTRLAKKIASILSAHAESKTLGEVYIEAVYRISAEPPTIRQPDVSFLSSNRVQRVADDEYIPGAPELAVEIVSPANSAQDLEEKIEQYLAAGSKAVWVVYPKQRRIHVFRPGRAISVLDETQQLTAPYLFPGFSVPVSELLV